MFILNSTPYFRSSMIISKYFLFIFLKESRNKGRYDKFLIDAFHLSKEKVNIWTAMTKTEDLRDFRLSYWISNVYITNLVHLYFSVFFFLFFPFCFNPRLSSLEIKACISFWHLSLTGKKLWKISNFFICTSNINLHSHFVRCNYYKYSKFTFICRYNN